MDPFSADSEENKEEDKESESPDSKSKTKPAADLSKTATNLADEPNEIEDLDIFPQKGPKSDKTEGVQLSKLLKRQ